MNTFATICTIILCLVPHGDLHDKIKGLDRQIIGQPRSIELRLMRGEFLRLHGEQIKALKDFQVAEDIDPQGAAVHLLKGQLFFDMKRHRAAAKELTRFLKAKPQSPEGLRAMAKNELARGDSDQAIALYRQLLRASPANIPDDILACARLIARAKNFGASKAAEFLQSELKTRGPLIVLELEAIQMETTARLFDAAIDRINRLSKKSKRQDLWDVRRAGVYRASGNVKSEMASWQAAKKNLKDLPTHVRRRPGTVAQGQKIEQEIKRLSLKKRD
ncbi:MAG: tetratricopeptide (TPR) repeat protein [Planctomycetota bacterium]|jgi:tetratricopeptide (TPR) repeat protein